ncbi:MAG TPA: sigma 54-interacting transcriptional regulator [Myxococcaceae bacterium]|jgi:transcriptional regulator of acetoin/glycerol metabolism
MQSEFASLVEALSSTQYFEEAASAVLRHMLRQVEEGLLASPWARRGRILRGSVYVRPDDSYRRMWGLEAARAAQASPEVSLLASTTAWRSVVRHRCAVSIDVNMGTLVPHHAAADPVEAARLSSRQSEFDGNESRQRFLGRNASHVHVLPLRVPGGSIDGMVFLEADCMAAVGQEFIWREHTGLLQVMADIAAPYLCGLPPQPVEAMAVDDFLPVVGSAMAGLVPILRVFAQQEETILLTGPTGAGKSRLARWCHEQSKRKVGHFEALDLMTIPEDLQMAELFGWRKGAFTGAVRDNPGCVARAEGGTLFIDEVDKLSLKAQAGLLHVLEERMYRTLGEGSGDRHANVRFVVGTNADLREAVRAGRFREDLYYRINVLPVRVPPLDERKDEIPLWAHYMLNRRHRETHPQGQGRMTPEAQRVLAGAPWPGNLRQLDNIIRRAYTLSIVESGGVLQDAVLSVEHVKRALGYEEESKRVKVAEADGTRKLAEVLCEAAEQLVAEVRRRGAPLDLDLTEAFRGFVLGTAVQRVGRDEAFLLLGRENLVKNRNHQKALRRELEKVDLLLRALGQDASPFQELLSLAAEEAS